MPTFPKVNDNENDLLREIAQNTLEIPGGRLAPRGGDNEWSLLKKIAWNTALIATPGAGPYSEVDFYATLPPANQVDGKIFVVYYSQGTPFVNRKPAGLYWSNAGSWNLLAQLPDAYFTNYVPTSRTINGVPLTSNITIDTLPSQTGNNGKYLTTDGTIASWATVAGSGDVTGPASAITDRIATFNGITGKLIKDGGKTIAIVLSDAAADATTKANAAQAASQPLARFCIYTQAGVLVTSQDMDWTSLGTGIVGLSVTHTPSFMRQWNNGTVSTTAVQLFVKNVAISLLDALPQREYRVAQSGMCLNSLTSPTAYTQAAQHANSADPAAAVLSNTTPSYTTLGGLFIGPTPTPVGATTDFALFAWTCPSPYTFHVTGCRINVINRGVIVATTATVLEWFLGFNASSGSLAAAAPYSPMKIEIGRQVFAIGATVESMPTPTDVIWAPVTPFAVQPGRTLIIGLRIPVGTATATGFLRGSATVEGFYE